jgi:DNA polymerase (family 10)
MPVHNSDIAAIFDEIADLLEIEGENPFRIRAYRNASRTIGDLGRELREMVEKGEELTEIGGIGKDLAKKIQEIVATGTSPALDELRKKVPPGIPELLRLQGLGPKRVKTLWIELKITSMADLEKAAREGKLKSIPGFGEKTEQNVLKSLAGRTEVRRFRRAAVVPYAEALLTYVGSVKGVTRAEIAGSYRRARETVGDLDILAEAKDAAAVMDALVGYDEVKQVLAKGDTKASVLLRSGIQVDLRVLPPESYGAALHYFTGSKAHNIALRSMGQKKGLKVNEYGVYRGEEQIAGRTEEEMYRIFDLPWIPPELREDRGEMDAAARDELPKLIELKDLRGDLHNHSTWSDGANTIEEMAHEAQRRGFEYMAITDHSKRLAMTNGLNETRLLEQMDAIDEINAKLKGFTILKGNEVDILEDGSLDLSDDILKRLDLVVGSVHSKFNLPRDKQTERILRAMDSKYFTILGHATGRLILSRDGYDVDVERIIRHAKQRGCYLELNANPERLDLNDIYCQMARSEGVLISIDCDGHSTREFANLAFGIGQARRGWLEKKDVLNTRSLKQLRPLLAKTMGD